MSCLPPNLSTSSVTRFEVLCVNFDCKSCIRTCNDRFHANMQHISEKSYIVDRSSVRNIYKAIKLVVIIWPTTEAQNTKPWLKCVFVSVLGL